MWFRPERFPGFASTTRIHRWPNPRCYDNKTVIIVITIIAYNNISGMWFRPEMFPGFASTTRIDRGPNPGCYTLNPEPFRHPLLNWSLVYLDFTAALHFEF